MSGRRVALTDIEHGSLAALLDDCRRELAGAVDDLERSRAAHRQVESLLLALLEFVPIRVVVVDGEGRIRATSKEAERTWGAQLGEFVAGVPPLGDAGIPELCRIAVEPGTPVVSPAAPDGFGTEVLEEPGTGERYVVVWATPAAG